MDMTPEAFEVLSKINDRIVDEAIVIMGHEAEDLGHLLTEEEQTTAAAGGYITLAIAVQTFLGLGWINRDKMAADVAREAGK